jgi:hypothetical protein
MYDYYFGLWGTFIGAPAISGCIYNGLHTILSPYGNIQQQTPGVYLDLISPVLMQFTTGWLNLANLQGYERFYECLLLAKYLSPHDLLIQVAYDYNPSIYHQSTFKPSNFSPSVPGPFGITTPFGSPSAKEQPRIHAKRQLCESFQLSVQEVFDPSQGTPPGAGFTMSGVNCLVNIKRAYRPIKGAASLG